MIHLIVLLVLIGIGILLHEKSYDFYFAGLMLAVLAGACLFVHLFVWAFVPHKYNVFIEERNAFEHTLNESRKSNNQYESAAIIKDVANWNQNLAKQKYENSLLFFDPYIDDRVDSLEFIK